VCDDKESSLNRKSEVQSIIYSLWACFFWGGGSLIPYWAETTGNLFVTISFVLFGFAGFQLLADISIGLFVRVWFGSLPQDQMMADPALKGIDKWACAAGLMAAISKSGYYAGASDGNVPASVLGPASAGYVIVPLIYELVFNRESSSIKQKVGVAVIIVGTILLAMPEEGNSKSFEWMWLVYILVVWFGWGLQPVVMQHTRFNQMTQHQFGDEVECNPSKATIIRLSRFRFTVRMQALTQATIASVTLFSWGCYHQFDRFQENVSGMVLYGIANGCANLAFFVALAHADDMSIPSAIGSAYGVIPLVFGWAYFGDAALAPRVAGAVLAIVGVVGLGVMAG
jgi:uncharacterized membrane protein